MSSNPATTTQPNAIGPILELMRSNIADIRSNMADIRKYLANTSLILETVNENQDALGVMHQNPTTPNVWVVSHTSTNWPYEIETRTSTTRIHGAKIQPGTTAAPTRNMVGIYQSAEAAKEAGRKWVWTERDERLDAYRPPPEDQQARLDVWKRDWYEAEYPEEGQELLEDNSNWAFWMRRHDDGEELGVMVQEWVVDHTSYSEGSAIG